MTKNSYDVSSPHLGSSPRRKPDSSFKSCVCVMLVILAICILLLLISLRWCKFGPVSKNDNKYEKGYDSLHGKSTTKSTSATTQISTVYTTETMDNMNENFLSGKNSSNYSSTKNTEIPTTPSQVMNNTRQYYDTTDYAKNNTYPIDHKESEIIINKEEVSTTTEANTTPERVVQRNSDFDANDEIQTAEANIATFTSQTSTVIEELVPETTETTSTTKSTTDKRFNSTNLSVNNFTSAETTTETSFPGDMLSSLSINQTEKSDKISTITTTNTPEDISTTEPSITLNTKMGTEESSAETTEATNLISAKYISTTNRAKHVTTVNTERSEINTTEKDIDMNESDFEITTSKDQINSPPQSAALTSLMLSDRNTCNTTKCDLTAARMISAMDETKLPCENFYDFACGGILGKKKEDLDIFASQAIAPEDGPEFLAKFNIFYRSCVRHEDRFNYRSRIDKAKDLLETVGSFQFGDQSNTTYNLTEFVANLILLKAMPLFDVDLDIDPDNSTYILKLLMPDQSSLDFEHWSSLSESKRKCLRETDEKAIGSKLNLTTLYKEYTLCQKNHSDYLESIETAVRELGVFSNLTERELLKNIKDIRFTIEFEILTLLDQLPPPAILEETIIHKQYANVKIGALEQQLPLIEWTTLFRLISNENINNETVIQIYGRPYFEEVYVRLTQLDRGKLNNAFLAILANSLYENTVLPSHRHTRVDYCKERSKELMPDIINYIIKNLIPQKEVVAQNDYILELYNNLKKQFSQSLTDLEWLDDDSRVSIRKKLEDIELIMFQTHNKYLELILLETAYSKLKLEYDDYQTNLFNVMQFRRKKFFSAQNAEASSENMCQHFVDDSKDQPVFFYTSNKVCIPYGLTKKASRDLPGYIIMAQVGLPLAKIIGHAFDSEGIQHRVKLSDTAAYSYSIFVGQSRDMISLSDRLAFGNRELFYTLNNGLSESNRIAENTALRLLTDSFNAFGNQTLLPWISYKFSREKIFFIAIAQEYCREQSLMDFMIQAYESPVLPPQFSVENILSNSAEFGDQFSCRPGSAMARMEERLQFPHLMEISREDMEYT